MTLFSHVDKNALNQQLLSATLSNNSQEVVRLLKIGADVNYKSNDSMTALYIAAAKGYMILSALLISMGADVNFGLNDDQTPLYIAIYHGHTDVIKLLVTSDAEITSDKYMNPLALAARLERHEIHQFLLEQYWIKLKQANLNSPACNFTFDDNKFEVVISRYNEDISWIEDEFPCNKVTIYNKGNDLPASPYYTEIKLTNLGYGEGSHFHHIIHNYYQLADRTLFIQANPYDAYIFLPLIRHKDELNSTCNNIIAKCEPGHNLQAESMAMQKFDWQNSKYKAFNYQDNDLIKFAEKFIITKIPERFAICYGRQSAIDKEVLLKHDITYYQEIANELNDSQYPIEAFYLERLWDLVFDYS